MRNMIYRYYTAADKIRALTTKHKYSLAVSQTSYEPKQVQADVVSQYGHRDASASLGWRTYLTGMQL